MSLGGPRHGARVWCLGRVPKHRNQWQELEGLLFIPQNSQLVHMLSFQSQAVVSLFIFTTGSIALNSEPCGRRYVKNMIYNRNRLYSRAIHCLESGWTKPWCPGLVSQPSAKAQEPVPRSRGLVIQPQKLSVGAYFELSFLGMWFVQKIRFSLLESGWTKAWCLGLVSRPSAKAQEPLNIKHLHTGWTMDVP